MVILTYLSLDVSIANYVYIYFKKFNWEDRSPSLLVTSLTPEINPKEKGPQVIYRHFFGNWF